MDPFVVPNFDIYLVLRRGALSEPLETEWHSSWTRPSAVSRKLKELPHDKDLIVRARDPQSGRILGRYDRDEWLGTIGPLLPDYLRDAAKIRYIFAKWERLLGEKQYKPESESDYSLSYLRQRSSAHS